MPNFHDPNILNILTDNPTRQPPPKLGVRLAGLRDLSSSAYVPLC
jgi:hypothetical protein